jgi:hypothetical protein
MNPDGLLSTLSSLTSVAFAILVARRAVDRQQPALVLWTIGLIWYAASTGSQALGYLHGWDSTTYRWWYLSGAFYTAAYLGMGSIYLVLPRQVAHAIMATLALGSVMVAPLVLLAPVDADLLPAPGEPPTGVAFSSAVRIATPVFNVFGAGALLLGALWGTWLHGRSPRGLANLLIAFGALVPSLASGLTRFGLSAGLALGQLVGLWLILAGFLLAIRAGRQRDAQPAVARTPFVGQKTPPKDRAKAFL